MKSPQLPVLAFLTCVLALAAVDCSSVDADPAGESSSAVKRGRDAQSAVDTDAGLDEDEDDTDGGPRHHHRRHRQHGRHHVKVHNGQGGGDRVLSFDGDCNKR